MLQLLSVRDLAVIDQVEVELDAGMTVLTGETGAGKSILVDALALALGQRADADALRPGADRAEVSAVFDCRDSAAARQWLAEHELEDEPGECLIRRVVTREGRSRGFINGNPVNLRDLRALGALLVDIHGQHAHQSLLLPGTQRQMVDFHGGGVEPAAQVAAAHRAWRDAEAALKQRLDGHADRAAQLDLWRFQLDELTQLDLKEAETTELEAERLRLANVGDLAERVGLALALTYEAEQGPAVEQVGQALRALQAAAALDESLEPACELLAQAEIQLQEANDTLRRYRDGLEADPSRLEWLESRLARIRELARKHRVEGHQLPEVLRELSAQLAAQEAHGESIEALEQAVVAAEQRYFTHAQRLSDLRRKASAGLSAAVTEVIHSLGMPKGQFEARLLPHPDGRPESTGLEDIEFLVSMNPGQPLRPLTKVASGGELSRVSLGVQVVATSGTGLPTMVFDEVDAGIGGGVAEIVGRRLRSLADCHQVLCVTHLPQVASLGQHHYRVAKLTDGATTRTRISGLTGAQRVDELSRMLGGVDITDRTRAHAEEMMERGRAG